MAPVLFSSGIRKEDQKPKSKAMSEEANKTIVGWIKREKSPEYAQGRGIGRFFFYRLQRPGYRKAQLVIGKQGGDISGYVSPFPVAPNFHEVAFTLKQGKNNIPASIHFTEDV
ncbi:MAG: hypothetical protein WAU00_15595 [Caldilinea sp.]